MSLRTGGVGRIFFTRWSLRATGHDAREAIAAMMTARRQVGQPLILVAILPPGMALPDHDARTAIVEFLPIFEHVCELQYAVLLGDSVGSALLRGAVALVSAILRQPVVVEQSVEKAVRRACVLAGMDATEVLDEARARGLIEASDTARVGRISRPESAAQSQ